MDRFLLRAVQLQYFFDVRTATRKLTEEELREVMLIENKQAGEFDLEMLRAEFSQYVQLDDFGFDMTELDKQLAGAVEDSNEQPEMPIVAKMSERYSCFVVVCRNEIDENHIAEKFGVERGKCYKSSKVGQMRVIDGKTLIERWNSRL